MPTKKKIKFIVVQFFSFSIFFLFVLFFNSSLVRLLSFNSFRTFLQIVSYKNDNSFQSLRKWHQNEGFIWSVYYHILTEHINMRAFETVKPTTRAFKIRIPKSAPKIRMIKQQKNHTTQTKLQEFFKFKHQNFKGVKIENFYERQSSHNEFANPSKLSYFYKMNGSVQSIMAFRSKMSVNFDNKSSQFIFWMYTRFVESLCDGVCLQ